MGHSTRRGVAHGGRYKDAPRITINRKGHERTISIGTRESDNRLLRQDQGTDRNSREIGNGGAFDH